MNAALIARLLRRRHEFASRDHWSRAELEVHQARALRQLRDFAGERSAFYRRFHKGLSLRPLQELPVLTKGELMEHFDEVCTDPSIRFAEVQEFLKVMRPGEAYRGTHYVAATSGSTGRRGVFVYDTDEWLTVLASYSRANDWAHVKVGLTRRLKLAVVSSHTPFHQSALVGATLQSRLVETLRLDSTESPERLVAQLNAFQPQSLVGYASMMRLLAEEQLAGRLRIAPVAVMSASEVLDEETRRRIHAAWGVQPFNTYAATEPAGIASECDQHRGMHLYEDLVITEVVDEQNRPVPPGEFGAKVLVTVLFSRTLPLIRYEMSDSVSLSAEVCPCGRPFGLIAGVQGRSEDAVQLPGVAGKPVVVRPLVFHRALEAVPASAWQVVQEPERLRVLIAEARSGFEAARVQADLQHELAGAGARAPEILIERVAAIPRTANGKAPLVKALKPQAVAR